MVAGRTTDPRSVPNVASTTASTAVTAGAGSFLTEDVGRAISGSGIPAGATLAAVASSTAATLSVAATTTETRAVTIGSPASSVGNDALGYGFFGWSPETGAESKAYSVAAVNAGTNPPDRITNTTTAVTQRTRG